MKILLASFGTRGDVQPYLALAVGLQRAGHHATLATSYNYTEWIASYGVNARPTPFNLQEFTQSPEVQAVLRSGNFFRQMGMLREGMRRRSLPRRSPFAPTRAIPSFFFGMSRASLGAGYNVLTHWLMHRALWSLMGGPITNPLRKKLGLPARRSFGEVLAESRRANVPWLYGFSAHVIPKPADWDEQQHITGYWFIEAPPGWQAPEALVRFLESGPPPVYIGFGSMAHEDPERQTRLALRALELSGQRGVLLTGWGGLTRQAMPSNVLVVEDVPHAWLFPRMAAVVHHGGAGTTAEGLRAGVPNIITAFAPNDQPAWADRVVKLGVGPRVPGIKGLTAEKLAKAIRMAVNDPTMRARAAALGEKIRAENGIARVVEVIERHAAGFDQHQRGQSTD